MNNISIFDQVLSQVNIIDIVSNYIDVSQKGKNFWSVCPFHNDSNPSMSISQEKQIYKCFSCGAAGNAVSFVRHMDNSSNIEALKKIAEIANVNVDIKTYNQKNKPQKTDHQLKLIEINNKANDFFSLCLKSEKGKTAYEYLMSRGIDNKIIEKFKIGFAPNDNHLLKLVKTWDYEEIEIADSGLFSLRNDKFYDFFTNRITFAISDEEDNTIAFSGRVYQSEDKRAKYSNSPETKIFTKSKILYNLSNAKKVLLQNYEIIVCEGFMDVIGLYKAGFENAVATMGTAFGIDQIKTLKRYTNTLNIFMDSDQAGQSAALKIASLAVKYGFEVKIVESVENMDVYDIYQNLGEDKLQSIVKESKKIFQYLVDNAVQKIDKNNIEQVTKFKKFVTGLIQDYKSKEEANIFKNIIKEELGIIIENNKPEQEIKIQMEKKVHKSGTFKLKNIRSEQKILLLMLKDRKASKLYKTKLNFLPTKIRKLLASYIVKYWETNSEFNTDTFAQVIKSVPEVYDEYASIMKLDSHIEYSQNEVEDIIEKIKNSISAKVKIKDLERKMELVQEPIEKAKILQEIHSIKKG